MAADLGSTPPLVIYQMGKVGSTALHQALSDQRSDVFQVHSLHPKRIEKSSRILSKSGLGLPRHLRQSQWLLKHFLDRGRSIKCITLIRSPLKRNISAFFQDLSTEVVLKPELREQLTLPGGIRFLSRLPLPNEWKNALIQQRIQSAIDLQVDELVSYFTENFQHRFPLDWFDFELNEALDINVYAYPFDASVGYLRIQNGPIDLLVLKSELSNDQKTDVIREFTGLDIASIKSQHVSSEKSYGKTMEAFKRRLHVNQSLMSEFNQSKFVRHFYPEGIF